MHAFQVPSANECTSADADKRVSREYLTFTSREFVWPLELPKWGGHAHKGPFWGPIGAKSAQNSAPKRLKSLLYNELRYRADLLGVLETLQGAKVCKINIRVKSADADYHWK